MKVKSESEVAQSCPTLSDPMDCSLPGSSVHGIFQARVLNIPNLEISKMKWGFPGGLVVKNPTANVGDVGSIPGLGRTLEKGMATHFSILV